jgi:AcrR family transcriptional regulator
MESHKTSFEAAAPPCRGSRAGRTIDKILAGAIRTILQRGAGKMSMLDVGEAAGVSRGTLYRYFPTKEKLLEAVTEHLTTQYNERVTAATAGREAPEDRFRAFLDFLGVYLDGGQPHRLLELEPNFALGFYRRNFPSFLERTQAVLEPVFESWEERAGVRMDRPLLAELMVRYILSDLLVPAGVGRRGLAERLMKLLADVGAH